MIVVLLNSIAAVQVCSPEAERTLNRIEKVDTIEQVKT